MSAFRDDAAAGTGLATVTTDGTVLDTWYPVPVLGTEAPDAPELEKLTGEDAAEPSELSEPPNQRSS